MPQEEFPVFPVPLRLWSEWIALKIPAAQRVAALLSGKWQNLQILAAAARFDAIRAQAAAQNWSWPIHGVAYDITQVVSSVYGAALVLDQHINSPGLVRQGISDAIAAVRPPLSTLDAVSIPQVIEAYAVHRRFVNDPNGTVSRKRRQRIDSAGLSKAAGSFVGWGVP